MKIKIGYDSPAAEFIAQKLLLPLLKYKPVDRSLSAFIWDDIFHLDEREIREYRAEEGFHMPGLFCIVSMVRDQYRGPRKVKERDKLWVRTDITAPGVWEVEIEWHDDRIRTESVFILNEAQWNKIRKHLHPIKWGGTDHGGDGGLI